MEDDYLLDDDDELSEDSYYQPIEDEDSEDEDAELEEEEASDESNSINITKESHGKITSAESWMISAYDDIIAAAKNDKDNALEDSAVVVLMANPKNTSSYTVGSMIKDLFQKQGHNRLVMSVYMPDSPLTGEDIDIDLLQEDDSGFNRVFSQEAKEQIARFIGYLASRDLSRDSVVSRNRKLRHIPAFIIFLISNGMYDLILNCPTMPPVYQKQINNAFERIMKTKYDIVEDLATRYDELGRHKVAERVRKLQLAWFNREPAEICTTSELADLDLTHADVITYREFRNKFTNTSKAITQDVISDLIEVVVDEEAGVYKKLKDKIRYEAIEDVKRVYKEWAKSNYSDKELANKIIWNN